MLLVPQFCVGLTFIASSHQSDELEEDAADEYMDEEPEILPKATTSRTAKKASASPAQPSSALKIKFSVKGKGRPLGPGSGAGEKRPSRAAARKSSKRTKLVAKDADLGGLAFLPFHPSVHTMSPVAVSGPFRSSRTDSDVVESC